MVQLICALGFKIDFEMFSDNFFRAQISEEESAYFLNMKGHLYCIKIMLSNGVQKKKSFYIPHFEAIPTKTLVKKYNKMLEETPWVLP